MLIPTLIMGIIAVVCFFIAYFKGEGGHLIGLKSAMDMTIQILPLLLCAFIVAGMIQVIVPNAVISKLVGTESGLRGIIIGSLAGGLAPGGPYICMPIVAGLLKTGASVGTMVAFVTGWALLAFARLPMDIGIVGWKFTAIRLGVTFLFPVIAGAIAQALFANIEL